MLRHWPIFFFILFQWMVSTGQNVTLTGKADSSYLLQARTIYAYTNDDFISYRETELGKSSLDAEGNFRISFPVSKPMLVFLSVDNAKAELVCEPGKAYEVNFLAKDSNAVNTLSLAVPVELEFRNSNETELNYLLADFTSRFESFLEDHRGMIAKNEPALTGKLDTLKTLFKKKYYLYNNEYLNNHIDFAFASLEESIALKEKGKVFKAYLHNKKIYQDNPDYMAFLHQFLSPVTDQYMKSGSMQLEVNSKQSFASVLTLYKQHKYLSNDTLCEIAVLKSLSEHYRYPGAYKINAVLSLLEQASRQCLTESSRKSAGNLIKKLSAMAPGQPVPAMTFRTAEGKEASLLNYKGKYIYLTFWTSWSSSSAAELMLIPDLKKIFGQKITFVSICLDKKSETMVGYLKKNPKLDWTFLYGGDYKKVKEEFNVLSVPAYFLIDPKGVVYKSPAPGPAEAEPLFMKIKKKQP